MTGPIVDRLLVHTLYVQHTQGWMQDLFDGGVLSLSAEGAEGAATGGDLAASPRWFWSCTLKTEVQEMLKVLCGGLHLDRGAI
jgi:hypothetical protein